MQADHRLAAAAVEHKGLLSTTNRDVATRPLVLLNHLRRIHGMTPQATHWPNTPRKSTSQLQDAAVLLRGSLRGARPKVGAGVAITFSDQGNGRQRDAQRCYDIRGGTGT